MLKLLLISLVVSAASAAPLFETRAVNDADCGTRKVSGNKVVGGTDAYYGQFPWLISLRKKSSSTGNFYHTCGASIIDNQWILCAAHCFIGANERTEFKVRAATLNQTAGTNEPDAKEYEVDKFIRHEGFSMFGKIKNDIALIKLKESVDFSSQYINRICIPDSSPYDTDEKPVVVAGWGDTVNGDGENIPAIMQTADMTAKTDEYCKGKWGFVFTNGEMVCADSDEASPCVGDSGGPLMMPDGDKMTTIGVVSYGSSTCRPDGRQPAVFTRVSYFLDWIRDTMAAN